jgi:nicotinate-nucleotide adenylyltransferase
LCRLAVEGEDGLEASRIEVDRPGPSFTAETLRSICEDSGLEELFFITGGDAAKELRNWNQPEEILRLATLAVAEHLVDDGARARKRWTAVPLARARRRRDLHRTYRDVPLDVTNRSAATW